QFTAVWFKGKIHRRAANIEQGDEFAVFQIDGGHLRRAGARDECLAVIGENGNVLGLMADGDRAAHSKSARVDKRNRITFAIADNDGCSVGRDAGEARRSANANGGDDLALIKVDDVYIG